MRTRKHLLLCDHRVHPFHAAHKLDATGEKIEAEHCTTKHQLQRSLGTPTSVGLWTTSNNKYMGKSPTN